MDFGRYFVISRVGVYSSRLTAGVRVLLGSLLHQD